MGPVELVDRPEIKVALQGRRMSLAEKREKAGGGFPFASGDHHERPGSLPFTVFLFAIIDPGEERPDDGSQVALWRALEIIEGERGLLPQRVFAANPGGG